MQPTPSATPTTRRDFLKVSATAAAGATLAGLDITRTAHAAGSDVIRLGMIGCGGRNTGAGAQALRADPGVRLVAMCDIFMDRVRGSREAIRGDLAKQQRGDQVQVPDDQCFAGVDGYKKVIECCDAVVIANAAKFHPLHTMAAIQAGKHVFVEKPHGIDPAGIKLLESACALAKEKKLCVVSGLHSRYHTGYQELMKRIFDGAIGDIVTIEENFLRAPYGITDRKPGLSELEWQFSTQYHFVWLSGDDVVQSLVHNMDRASWALKEQAPVRCHGLGGRSSMTDAIYGDVFDHHTVVYQYENGARVYALCRTTTGCYDEYSSLIFGTKGRADVMACRIWGEKNWRGDAGCDAHYQEQVEYMKAIRAYTPINNGDYMARSTLIGIMGQISCYTGKEVTWEQITASDFFFPPRAEDCRDGMEPPTKPGPNGSYPVYIPGRTRLI
ncbi:MAG TPA: Gfo/Idh/MocA family oxidoreductase [Verrucomicrobiota bacterium]|nr:Gfo/Idh/MocA family oxidoreductase [Verrucomicrobiota bacterium]HRZ36748.1 Gfo/Idh/MocA family oxidoreductase [Candidatus Paceibacterota bacterium]HRZ57405.1 Gfo/Idh/MocA family oxidoreductase [Candidatus Paceibacterota bacterium]